MEKSSNDSKPILCTAGCGFYGSAMYNNMCSKCFKEKRKDDEPSPSSPILHGAVDALSKSPSTSTHDITPVSEPFASSDAKDRACRKHPRSRSPSESTPVDVVLPPPSSSPASSDPSVTTPTSKPVQVSKGRCFECRAKIPLAKQATNKCRCEYVFCDAHRFPDLHGCDVDHAKRDRVILAKNNPKLHERPKGGRSFQRIDSL